MRYLFLVCSTLLVAACKAQSPVGPAALTAQSKGHAYAQATCSACHAIGIGSASSPNPKAPEFAAIVNQEDLTERTLSSWLKEVHNYPREMDFKLDPSKVDVLVTYMLTLRDTKYKPPS